MRGVSSVATLTSKGQQRRLPLAGMLIRLPTDYREQLDPVASLYKDASVKLTNDTPFRLGSTCSQPAASTPCDADKIGAGMVFVNTVGAEGVELPFGGVKRSSFGACWVASALTNSSTRTLSASLGGPFSYAK